LGYEVDVVSGSAKERLAAIDRIKQNVRAGLKYDFLYSESSTTPTLLTESHHLPTHPFLDFGFFRWFRKNAGPVGLFYRDAHWKFSQYRNNTSGLKSLVGRIFHQLDLVLYLLTVDQIFLPSIEMRRILPSWLQSKVRIGLPAGCEPQKLIETTSKVPLNLFYVGGVSAPIYDLMPLFRTVMEVGKDVKLTVCCRASEWAKSKARYQDFLGDNVTIVHASGPELEKYYRQADAFVMLRAPHPYLSFAVSYKVFEAVSWGLPLLVDAHEGAVINCMQKGDWGVAVKSEAEAISKLHEWRDNPQVLQNLRARALARIPHESWEARARQVRQMLEMCQL
jgi:glycosyltransferase involved in cell wall biosynthesis